MAELTSMRNIGKEMENKLKSIDVHTAEDLTNLGAKDAFLRLKLHHPNICLVHLYVLQGAIDDIDYNHLTEDVKADLKNFSDELK